jgi:hypothetical protein
VKIREQLGGLIKGSEKKAEAKEGAPEGAEALDWLGGRFAVSCRNGMNWLYQGSIFALACGMSVLASCPAVQDDGRRTEAQWAADRARMVREQLAALDRDIKDPAVLQAMGKVPRHRFVPQEIMGAAYDDRPLPIGYGQTISQPGSVLI